MTMKVLKRVFSRKGESDDIVLETAPGMPHKMGTKRKSLPNLQLAGVVHDDPVPVSPKPNRRRKSVSPKPTSRRNKQISARRQEKIQQFLKQGSFVRRTWEQTEVSATVTTESHSSSSISLSSSTSDEDMDESHQSHMSAPTFRRDSLQDLLMAPTAVDLDALEDEEDKKLVRWDSFVERDQTKRELTRQFRSAAPEWKQRQMAHRVHHCNARKAELEEFRREFLDPSESTCNPDEIYMEDPESKEIEVAPAAGGWFERNDRDISAEFLMMDIDLFGNNKKNIESAGRSVASF